MEPESTSNLGVDVEPPLPWLKVAIVAQLLSVAWSFMPSSTSNVGLITTSIFNLALLLLLKRGFRRAGVVFLTLSIWGLVIRALGMFLARYFPNAEYEINWVSICLTVVAVFAVLKIPKPA